MTSPAPALLAGLLLSAVPGPTPGAERLFLVGAPATSFEDEVAELRRLGELCAPGDPVAGAQRRACLRTPGDQQAFETVCRNESVELGHAEAQRRLLEALARCDPGREGVQAPTEAARAPGLLGPAGLESVIIGGLADFVVNRARSESIDFALDQVAVELCAKPSASRLFPALCALSRAADQVRMALVPGRMLRDAVAADLRALPRHLADLAAKEQFPEGWRELSCALRLADGVGGGLERREPPLALALAAGALLDQDDVCRALLGGSDTGAGPAATSENAQALHLALRLSVARAGAPGAGGLATVLEAGGGDLRRTIREAPVAGKVRALAGPAAEALLGPALRIRLAVEAYLAADAAGRAAALPELLAATLDFVGAAIDQGLAMQPATPELAERRRRVAGAVAMARHTLGGEYAAALTDLLASGLIDPSREPYASLLRVSSLVVEVGSAHSSAEVAQALEAAAAPSGSWRLRRKKSVWGLSARVGMAASREWVQGTPAAPAGTVLGFHAPVGLDASWPLGGTFTFGLMVQALDLGALVGARVEGGGGAAGAKDLPQVGVAQVFSPGGSASLGLGKSPFLLSLGGSFSPGLRPVSTGGDARNVWRVTLGLSVDVPIFMW